MAKFQLCEFMRKPPQHMMKRDNIKYWERGLAVVSQFNDTSNHIKCVVDALGKNVEKPYRIRLMVAHAYTAIDTEARASILQ